MSDKPSGVTRPTLPSFLSWVFVLPLQGDWLEQSRKFSAAAVGLPGRISFAGLLTSFVAHLQFPSLGGGVAVEQIWGFSVLQGCVVAVCYGHSYRTALTGVWSQVGCSSAQQ